MNETVTAVVEGGISMSDIISAAIGGFFGFGFSLLVEAVVTHIMNRRNIRRCIRNIRSEIHEIVSVLESNKDQFTSRLVYSTPIWETVLQTGIILYFLKKTYYHTIISFYSAINCLSQIEVDIESEAYILEKRQSAYESGSKLLNHKDFAKE